MGFDSGQTHDFARLLCFQDVVEGPKKQISHVQGFPIPVRLDAYFVLNHTERPDGKNTFHFFLEADRSTMAHSRMAAKIVGYLAYYEQGLYKKKYSGMPGFLATTVTETRSRAEELRKDLYPLIPRAARSRYLFLPFEDLKPTNLIADASQFSDSLLKPASRKPAQQQHAFS